MAKVETTDQLLAMLIQQREYDGIITDPSKLKYAIYTRRSTQNDERQERSTDDQLSDCIDNVVNASDVPLNIVQTIKEDFSAKEPDVRGKFTALMNDIKSGKINGLIAWHPDRLARNMKEAGEIIDLLDKGILADLRFATSKFENNPTGKMLLGMSFVLSKQYSEHLSESVNRGNRRSVEGDGKYLGKLVHGYYIDEQNRLYPDGLNFQIIREAFEKRMQRISQKDIAKWLNTTNYKYRRRGKNPEPYTWRKDDVSTMFKRTLYAGVLKYGANIVKLDEKYDFTTLVSVKEFFSINKIKTFSAAMLEAANKSDWEPMRSKLLNRKVTCGHCSELMTTSPTSKKLKDVDTRVRYYYFKCETDKCPARGRSLRVRWIIIAAQAFLGDHHFTTKNNYKYYVTDAKKYITSTTGALNSRINSLSRVIGDKNSRFDETKAYIVKNKSIAAHYDLDGAQADIDKLVAEQKKLIAQRTQIKDSILVFEKYLELMRAAPVILDKMDNMKAMDFILQKFFSNFTVWINLEDKKQRPKVELKLKEPWDGFVKDGDFEHGWG